MLHETTVRRAVLPQSKRGRFRRFALHSSRYVLSRQRDAIPAAGLSHRDDLRPHSSARWYRAIISTQTLPASSCPLPLSSLFLPRTSNRNLHLNPRRNADVVFESRSRCAFSSGRRGSVGEREGESRGDRGRRGKPELGVRPFRRKVFRQIRLQNLELTLLRAPASCHQSTSDRSIQSTYSAVSSLRRSPAGNLKSQI